MIKSVIHFDNFTKWIFLVVNKDIEFNSDFTPLMYATIELAS
jgi:hypothetical protein